MTSLGRTDKARPRERLAGRPEADRNRRPSDEASGKGTTAAGEYEKGVVRVKDLRLKVTVKDKDGNDVEEGKQVDVPLDKLGEIDSFF